MNEPPSIKLKPRRGRWVLRLLLSVVVCLLISAVLLWWKGQREAFHGRAELDEVIAETDRLDPRWRWEQILADRRPLPEAEDSMRVIHAAAKVMGEWKPKELWLANDDDLLDNHLPANRRFSDERLKAVRDLLQKRQAAVPLAASLKDYPRGRGDYQIQLNVLNTLMGPVTECRDVVTLLILEAERLLHEGKSDEAADRIVAMMNASAALREDPFLISYLSRVAVRDLAVHQTQRLLGMGGVSAEACLRLEYVMGHRRYWGVPPFCHRKLDFEEEENLFLTALRGERAMYHLLFDNLELGRLPLSTFMAQAGGTEKSTPDLMTRLSAKLYEPRLYEDHAHLLRRFNEFSEIAMKPYWEQQAEWAAFEQEVRALRVEMLGERRLILSLLLIPAVGKVAAVAPRDQANTRSGLVALACEMFRLKHQRWPKSLEELCPAYLSEVPADPYTGEPLRYAVKGDGAVVYSVGPDGVDGGGAELRPPKGNATAPHDLGFRLWNPDRRGLPAEKPKDDGAEP